MGTQQPASFPQPPFSLPPSPYSAATSSAASYTSLPLARCAVAGKGNTNDVFHGSEGPGFPTSYSAHHAAASNVDTIHADFNPNAPTPTETFIATDGSSSLVWNLFPTVADVSGVIQEDEENSQSCDSAPEEGGDDLFTCFDINMGAVMTDGSNPENENDVCMTDNWLQSHLQENTLPASNPVGQEQGASTVLQPAQELYAGFGLPIASDMTNFADPALILEHALVAMIDERNEDVAAPVAAGPVTPHIRFQSLNGGGEWRFGHSVAPSSERCDDSYQRLIEKILSLAPSDVLVGFQPCTLFEHPTLGSLVWNPGYSHVLIPTNLEPALAQAIPSSQMKPTSAGPHNQYVAPQQLHSFVQEGGNLCGEQSINGHFFPPLVNPQMIVGGSKELQNLALLANGATTTARKQTVEEERKWTDTKRKEMELISAPPALQSTLHQGSDLLSPGLIPVTKSTPPKKARKAAVRRQPPEGTFCGEWKEDNECQWQQGVDPLAIYNPQAQVIHNYPPPDSVNDEPAVQGGAVTEERLEGMRKSFQLICMEQRPIGTFPAAILLNDETHITNGSDHPLVCIDFDLLTNPAVVEGVLNQFPDAAFTSAGGSCLYAVSFPGHGFAVWYPLGHDMGLVPQLTEATFRGGCVGLIHGVGSLYWHQIKSLQQPALRPPPAPAPKPRVKKEPTQAQQVQRALRKKLRTPPVTPPTPWQKIDRLWGPGIDAFNILGHRVYPDPSSHQRLLATRNVADLYVHSYFDPTTQLLKGVGLLAICVHCQYWRDHPLQPHQPPPTHQLMPGYAHHYVPADEHGRLSIKANTFIGTTGPYDTMKKHMAKDHPTLVGLPREDALRISL
ncbi:hypothetical protein T439DRAFT_384556 [Meredithblackwellia eburnea MCA 4105]